MIETVLTIKSDNDGYTDSFEIVHDSDDNTVSFFVLNMDDGLTFKTDDIPLIIQALQRIQNLGN